MIDPEVGASVIDLKMVRRICVENGTVVVDLVLTAPGCPLAGWIAQHIRQAVGAIPGVVETKVNVLDERWDPDGDDWQNWIP